MVENFSICGERTGLCKKSKLDTQKKLTQNVCALVREHGSHLSPSFTNFFHSFSLSYYIYGKSLC